MITVKNLTKKFDNNKVLSNIDFDIKRGEIVGLLGPNGAGKTTTMRILTGYLSANEGEIKINARDIDDASQLEEIKKLIGYLPENNPLYGEMLVDEYLKMMAELKQIDKEKREKKIKEAVEKTGIADVYYKQISNLSKGYKQRVGLASAILGDPEILILDEPTEGLDPNQRIDIRNLIKSLGKNKTVIISSHVLQEIENTCKRIIIIKQGEIAADGSTREIIDNAEGKKTLSVEIEGSKIEENIKEILGNGDIKEKETVDGRTRLAIDVDQNNELRPKIFNMAKNNGWTIWEMHQKEMSLEDVFRELTK